MLIQTIFTDHPQHGKTKIGEIEFVPGTYYALDWTGKELGHATTAEGAEAIIRKNWSTC